MKANLMSKSQGHWQRKCKIVFSASLLKLDSFTSNQDQTKVTLCPYTYQSNTAETVRFVDNL